MTEPKFPPSAAPAMNVIARQPLMRSPEESPRPFGSSGCCQWPLWQGEARSGDICGGPLKILREGTAHEKTSPYCAYHHLRAYPPHKKDR